MKKISIAFRNILSFVIFLGLSLNNYALASTTTGSEIVNITVSLACTISTGANLTFPNFTGSVDDTNAAVLSVYCPNTLNGSITLDNGLNYNGGLLTRQIKCVACGNTVLPYAIYTDNTYTILWQNATGVSITGNNTTQNVSAYGRIPAGVIPKAGTYADTITATLTF